jgi:hypothetical protein
MKEIQDDKRRVVISSPEVDFQMSKNGEMDIVLKNPFSQLNCECSACENDTGPDGCCERDY